jgi:hypothetical protein
MDGQERLNKSPEGVAIGLVDELRIRPADMRLWRDVRRCRRTTISGD